MLAKQLEIFCNTETGAAADDSDNGDSTGGQEVWEPPQKTKWTVPGSRERMLLAV